MPHAASLALVLAAAVLAYANATGGALVFDAHILVGQNPALQVWSTETIRYVFTHDYWQPMATDGLYRPITMLSFLFDRAVLGHGDVARSATWSRTSPCTLACAMLVYALVWHLGRGAGRRRSRGCSSPSIRSRPRR